MLCIIIIAKMLIKLFIPVCTSVPNRLNIFLYIVELSISPFIAEFNMLPISISSKNLPVYSFEFSINELIPKLSCWLFIVLSSKLFALLQ